jgi:hypothetical protein
MRVIPVLMVHNHVGVVRTVKDALGWSTFSTRNGVSKRVTCTFAFLSWTIMSDSLLQTADPANEPVPSQDHDVMNPETFIPPDNKSIPRITIEFCDRVRA